MPRAIVRDFLTGLTAIAGVCGLFITLMVFGELSNVGQKRYQLTVHVGNASGLNDSSPVTLNGVKVGQVSKIDVRMDGTPGAQLTLRIREEAKIPRASMVTIDKGLLGDAGLEFSIPPELTVAERGDVMMAGETVDLGSPMSPIERITKLVEKPLTRLASTADSVDELARTYKQVGDRLNDMLEPRTQAEVAAGKSPNLRSTLERADAAIASAQNWLGDDELRTNTRDTIARAKNLTDELTTLSKAWTVTAAKTDETLSSVATDTRRLSDRATAAIETLSAKADTTLTSAQAAAAELETVAARINRGEGTLGQLANNPDLYRSLNDATQRLDKALADLQGLIAQFRTEGIPIDF